MTEVVAIIPARYDSTRLPGKALADIHGKPLIRHVYERVMQSSAVSRVVVATDDTRIADAVEAFGGQAVMTSPDHTSGTDRIVEAMSVTGGDIIVNVQGDEPMIEPAVIDAVVGTLAGDDEIVCATAAFQCDDIAVYNDPNAVKVVLDSNGRALYFSRAPIPCYREGDFKRALVHVGIYCFRRDFLEVYSGLAQTPLELSEKLEQLRIIENGYRIGVAVIGQGAIGVDTPEDLEKVRELMNLTAEVTSFKKR
ncbi:3-deoxy-manno-octulosonate cytidylyltransferase [Candidatus Latescibacterota bacterium]